MGLESAVGLGSTFWFELELQKQPVALADVAAGGELVDVRVMLVGFPAPEQMLLAETLQGWGDQSLQLIR